MEFFSPGWGVWTESPWGPWGGGGAHLARVVVDDEAGTPAVEVLVGAHGRLQLLQQRLVGAAARGVHGGAHVVQDAHDARWVLRERASGRVGGVGGAGISLARPCPHLAHWGGRGEASEYKSKKVLVGGPARWCRIGWGTP